MDILNWITDSLPTRVASFGDTRFFLPGKAPATHCSICPESTACRFRFGGEAVFLTDQEKLDPSAADHDLCVFTPDKDIVDNQVAILEYANGIKATFSLQLFHHTTTRKIRITGDLGELKGDLASNTLTLLRGDGTVEPVDVNPDNDSAHNGGDLHLLNEFRENIRHGTPPSAGFVEGVHSNAVALAVEKARRLNQVVSLQANDYAIQ